MKGLPHHWLGLILLSGSLVACAQDAETTAPAGEVAQASPVPSCVDPPPMIRWEDYNGPFAKVVGTFGRNLERKAVHPLGYKPVKLCSLKPRDKFRLFLYDSMDPAAVFVAGYNSGLDQASNRDPTFGQGGLGYARRFGASFAGQTASRFFADFLYPTIFSEDPRYYRMGRGDKKTRLLHAMSHTLVAQRDDGRSMLNFSEWLAAGSSAALSNLYHPGTRPGVGAAVRSGAFVVLQDMGFDILREFWPEVARTLKMPFRGLRE